MAKLQQALNEEIRRLSRKEITGTVKTLKSQISGLRELVKELNIRVKALEKFHPKAETNAAASEESRTPAKSVRVTSARIKKWRTKLGLSQAQYAVLLDVNAISVNHWETGKTVPRLEQKLKISRVRDLSKRELAKLLAEKNISAKVKAAPLGKASAVQNKASAKSKPVKPDKKS